MLSIRKLGLAFLGIPKTIVFNFKYFRLKDAIRLPVLVSHRVRFAHLQGKVFLYGKVTFGRVRIGFGEVNIFDPSRSRSVWDNTGTVLINGHAKFGHGTKISVSGEIIFGDNFETTAECQIYCVHKISIGENVIISWDTLLMDTDSHSILNENMNILNPDKEIVISNNVWIGCRCLILKGVFIGDNVVVAANTTLHRSVKGNDMIIGGNPPKILRESIQWYHTHPSAFETIQ